MPYKSGEVPGGTDKVPPHGQAIYRGAFNAAYRQYGEEKAHAIAWSAVKHKFKKKGDRWVSKDGLQALDWSEESRAAALEAKRAHAREKPGPQAARAYLEKLKADYAREGRENGWDHPRTKAVERAMIQAQKAYGTVHRAKDALTALFDLGDEGPGHPFRGNQYTTGQSEAQPETAGSRPDRAKTSMTTGRC